MGDKQQAAERVVKQHVIWSVGAGLVPVPVVDFVAVTGIQIDLIHQLCALYGVNFEESKGKVWVGALTGGAVARLGASAIKAIPGIGSLIGGLSMSIASGASTYAVGQVVLKHLEGGGTMQDLDVEAAKRRYAEAYEQGKQVAREASEQRQGSGDVYEKLEKLGKLKQQGVITDAEFEEKKKKLLETI
jgi:uncharacterized protein (DUF697 family)